LADLLIIDDDLDSAESLSLAMLAAGHEVRIGYNGCEGLRLVKERTPDLVLLDVEMPIMDGPGMAMAMVIHDMGHENAPLILLSGVPRLVEVARKVGTPYFLGKPFRLAAISALVKQVLDERVAPHRQAMPVERLVHREARDLRGLGRRDDDRARLRGAHGATATSAQCPSPLM